MINPDLAKNAAYEAWLDIWNRGENRFLTKEIDAVSEATRNLPGIKQTLDQYDRYQNWMQEGKAKQRAYNEQKGGFHAFLNRVEDGTNLAHQALGMPIEAVSRVTNIDPRAIGAAATVAAVGKSIKFPTTISKLPVKKTIKGKSKYASDKVVDTTAYSPVKPKANIPKYSSGPVVQTKEGTFYRPTERLASQFAHTGEGTITKPIKFKSGGKDATNLKHAIAEKVKGLVDEGVNDPIKFDALRKGMNLENTKGVKYNWTGLKKVVKGLKAGDSIEQVAKEIQFSRSKAGEITKRVVKTNAPVDEIIDKFKVKRSDIPEKELIRLANLYKTKAKQGYAVTQEGARRTSLTGDELLKEMGTGVKITDWEKKPSTIYQSGHTTAALSESIHPDKPKDYTGRLYDPPTDALSTTIEERTVNIQGSNNPEHDINPYLADLMGIPTTWEKGFEYFIDSELKEFKLKDWREEHTPDQMRKAIDADRYMNESEALEFFKKEIEPFNPKYNLKDIQRQEKYTQPGKKFDFLKDEYSTFEDWEQSFAPRKPWLTAA